MFYEINVSLNGRHFFATSPRSLLSMGELEVVVPIMIAKFPRSEGYAVTVTRVETTGVDLSQLFTEYEAELAAKSA